VARAAGLLAVAAIRPLAGLTGEAYTDPARFLHGFRIAMVVCAALMGAAAALAFWTVTGRRAARDVQGAGAAVQVHCAAAGAAT